MNIMPPPRPNSAAVSENTVGNTDLPKDLVRIQRVKILCMCFAVYVQAKVPLIEQTPA